MVILSGSEMPERVSSAAEQVRDEELIVIAQYEPMREHHNHSSDELRG